MKLYLTDWEDLKSVHSNARVIHLKLTVSTINHKHDSIHCKQQGYSVIVYIDNFISEDTLANRWTRVLARGAKGGRGRRAILLLFSFTLIRSPLLLKCFHLLLTPSFDECVLARTLMDPPVREVSAMLVATTHFLIPSGAFWKILAWRSEGSWE